MYLKEVVELTWRTFQSGRPDASKQTLTKQDIAQEVKILFSDLMRQKYYESKATDKFNEPDYSFISPLISCKRFPLPACDIIGKRRVDMSEFDLYRLPKNSHFTNVYPVSDGGCGNQEVGEITQVSLGEENFYINNKDLENFQFYVVKGRGLDTYHIPPCITGLDVEATYDLGEDTDLDMELCATVVDHVLGVTLGVKKQYYSEKVQQEMSEQNIIKR